MKIGLSSLPIALVLFSGCIVSKQKYVDSQIALRSARSDSAWLDYQLRSYKDSVAAWQERYQGLAENNHGLEGRLASAHKDMASKEEALSKSREEYSAQQARLEQLQNTLDQQKKKAAELKKKMADALQGFNSNELTVSTRNGKVYVSLQENLLFPSASAEVNEKGKQALGKLAGVLNVNPDIAVNIEGHTDSIPIRGRYEDNWALSVARATSIVRILVNDYQVDPARVEASGHSQFDPVEANSTPEGRARNRRTEIILTPKLDELYKLLGT